MTEPETYIEEQDMMCKTCGRPAHAEGWSPAVPTAPTQTAETHLAHISAYAKEAARTPIDRDTILGCWDVEQLRMYALTLREESTGLIRLILQPETYR